MLEYNAPDGSPSTIDASSNNKQMRAFFFIRKAITYLKKDMYFTQLSNPINVPRNWGKTVRVYEYYPLLDDRNINDQGLDAAGATLANGNLYGSSRDVGYIASRIPLLGETGGRVNRIGFTRIVREAQLYLLGFFYEFTKESIQFDSDDQLMMHLARELLNGAVQLHEAMVQKDLLLAAGVVHYAGAAVSDATVTGESSGTPGQAGYVPPSVVVYEDFIRLDQTLYDNRSPKQTTIITGSRLVDTKTLNACRVLYVGTELITTLKTMVDPFGAKAFIEVQHYANSGTVLAGEVGSIDNFRIIQVMEMLSWRGKGAAVTANPGYRSTVVAGAAHYDIYPMLCVGEDSFSCLGFEVSGESAKMNIITKMPGKDIARPEEPFGQTGFSSISWYYGMLLKKPERIGMIKTVARI